MNKKVIFLIAALVFSGYQIGYAAISAAGQNDVNVSGSVASGSASTDNPLIVGGKAETTTPTAVDDGDAVFAWFDEYGRLVIKGLDLASNSLNTTPIGVVSGTPLGPVTQAALTAEGTQTTGVNVLGCRQKKYSFVVASIDTNVVVEMQGQDDGTNWHQLAVLDTTPSANLTLSGNRATVSANGNYYIETISGAEKMRFSFVSEAGGTNATITPTYLCSNP